MLNNLFSAEVLQETLSIVQGQFLLAFWETLYVTIAAMFFAVVIGLPLGVILVVGEKGGLAPLPGWLMKTINVIINLLRSVPFLILMILLFPFTRAVVGTAVGTVASIVPLVVAAFPFVARLVESSLRELNPNIIEMSRSMGASPMQTIIKVMIPEAMPSLISNATAPSSAGSSPSRPSSQTIPFPSVLDSHVLLLKRRSQMHGICVPSKRDSVPLIPTRWWRRASGSAHSTRGRRRAPRRGCGP